MHVSPLYLLCCVFVPVQSWTKMDKPAGAPWPVERSSHAACCLNYGQEHPQLLISGGRDKDSKTLGDAWLLSVATGTWREVGQ